VDKNL